MGFLQMASSLISIYKTFKVINNILIDETANTLNYIGEKDFEAALKSLRDSKLSYDKEREYNRSITLLRSAVEKISDENNSKVKGLILIAISYDTLNEKILRDKYKELAKLQFFCWINAARPYGRLGVGGMGLARIFIKSYATYKNTEEYDRFRRDIISLGLEWKQPIFTPGLKNGLFFNKYISIASEHAIEDFNEYMDHLF